MMTCKNISLPLKLSLYRQNRTCQRGVDFLVYAGINKWFPSLKDLTAPKHRQQKVKGKTGEEGEMIVPHPHTPGPQTARDEARTKVQDSDSPQYFPLWSTASLSPTELITSVVIIHSSSLNFQLYEMPFLQVKFLLIINKALADDK